METVGKEEKRGGAVCAAKGEPSQMQSCGGKGSKDGGGMGPEDSRKRGAGVLSVDRHLASCETGRKGECATHAVKVLT